MDLKAIGLELKKYRFDNNLTLRDFCIKYKLDASTVSKLERGCDDSVEKSVEGMIKAIATIKTQNDEDKKYQGMIECPVCQGKLHYTIAKINGHIWGRCETENCLNWMQ